MAGPEWAAVKARPRALDWGQDVTGSAAWYVRVESYGPQTTTEAAQGSLRMGRNSAGAWQRKQATQPWPAGPKGNAAPKRSYCWSTIEIAASNAAFRTLSALSPAGKACATETAPIMRLNTVQALLSRWLDGPPITEDIF